MKFGFFGRSLDVATELSNAHRQSVISQNHIDTKNHHVLSKLIDCIKFCDIFELVLSGHDETKNSENPGIFLGLVNFTAEQLCGNIRILQLCSRELQKQFKMNC